MVQEIEKYINYGLVLILIFLSYLILKPYLLVIATSIIFAVICYPGYTWVNKIIKNKSIAAAIVTIALLILIIVPVILIGNIIRVEATELYQNLNVTEITSLITEKLDLELSNSFKQRLISDLKILAGSVFTTVSSFVLSIPQKILGFIILIFVFFYALKDGKKIMGRIKDAIPISLHNKKRLEERVSSTITSLLYGEIAISILEWLIATLGFFLIGVSSPGLLGLLVGIVALLPAIGPTIIWAPVAIYLYLIGETTKAILVGLFGFIVLTVFLDAIVRAKILGIKGHIHPVLILVGVLGGLATFGIIGLILGPIVLVLLELLFEIYTEEKARLSN